MSFVGNDGWVKWMDKDDISLCVFCHCMTHTVEYGFCGKCGVQKALAKDGLKMKDG